MHFSFSVHFHYSGKKEEKLNAFIWKTSFWWKVHHAEIFTFTPLHFCFWFFNFQRRKTFYHFRTEIFRKMYNINCWHIYQEEVRKHDERKFYWNDKFFLSFICNNWAYKYRQIPYHCNNFVVINFNTIEIDDFSQHLATITTNICGNALYIPYGIANIYPME